MKSITNVAAKFGCTTLLFCCAVLLAAPAGAAQVFVPDNGFGTAQVPILADYVSETPMQIIDGLGGSTIDIDATLETPTVYSNPEQAGGSLGGTKTGGGGGGLFTFQMQGTGLFAGYNRTLNFGVAPGPGGVLSFPDANFNATAADFEVHTAPRTLNAPLQSFDTDMFRMFGQIVNPGDADPDFDLLRVVAGTDFGLPSPGHTTLLQAGPNWEVDSFFDLTYRIDFVGKVGGPFQGRSGSTTGTVRISLGEQIVPEPACAVLAGIGIVALAGLLRPRSRRQP
jgi:hypothetical protein